jgi:Uncharacterized conserved protein
MKLTDVQLKAQDVLAGEATHVMLFGGSRSGKTFLHIRNLCMRAIKAPNSRHVAFRFRFNAIKASIVMDTLPKVMRLAFPGVKFELNKTDWFARFENGSEIWFAGLDDGERVEKILGMEFSTIFFNECSQIPWDSRNVAITRLAQKATQVIQGRAESPLKPRVWYDCNPPSKAHWSYRLFIEKRDPETKEPVRNTHDYASVQINPKDNAENLTDGYLDTLQGLSARMRRRFLDGAFADATPNALFADDVFEKWRVIDGELPQFVRVVVAVDPSGADDSENADNDAIGIVVMALGTDGNAYLLEDCTVKAGPATWGKIATDAYDRHSADVIVGETNYGGAMVKYTIQTHKARVPFKMVTATRGKAVRAEPVSSLYEQGKVRHVGNFAELEDELSAFSTFGYTGANSPNRADALVWAVTELFPGVIAGPKREKKPQTQRVASWMG